MRVTVKLKVDGSSLDEIIENVVEEWQKFSDRDFPQSTEITVEKTGEMYRAEVLAQVRIEQGH